MDHELEKIELFIKGELAEDEHQLLLVRMNEDIEFKRKVNEYRLILGAFRENVKQNLWDRVQEESIQYKKKNNQKVIILIIGIAASLLLILIALPFFKSNYLINKYYSTLNGLSEINRSTDNFSPTFVDAYQAYLQENYPKAIQLLLEQSELNQNEKLLLGKSYLSSKQALEALEIFQSLPESPLTQWCIGLTYIQEEQWEKAISIFEQLSRHPSIYQSKSQKVLRKLKQTYFYFL